MLMTVPGPVRLVLPATISVAVLGASCGPPPEPKPDGGQLCPTGCSVAKEADGGIYRTEDGGVQCLC